MENKIESNRQNDVFLNRRTVTPVPHMDLYYKQWEYNWLFPASMWQVLSCPINWMQVRPHKLEDISEKQWYFLFKFIIFILYLGTQKLNLNISLHLLKVSFISSWKYFLSLQERYYIIKPGTNQINSLSFSSLLPIQLRQKVCAGTSHALKPPVRKTRIPSKQPSC